MLEVKEKISSYCKTLLPGEVRVKILVKTFYVFSLVSVFAVAFNILEVLKHNLLHYLATNLTMVFIILASIFVSLLSFKGVENNSNKFYPEKHNEAKNLLLQIVNTPEIFKMFNSQELKEDFKTLICFIDKEQLSLDDLLTIKNILTKVLPNFETEFALRQNNEKTKQILLNCTTDNKNTQNLMKHLSLYTDVAPNTASIETKDKTLYAQK